MSTSIQRCPLADATTDSATAAAVSLFNAYQAYEVTANLYIPTVVARKCCPTHKHTEKPQYNRNVC